MTHHDAAAPIPDLAGRVQTVLGPVDPATLGVTLTHEHIFIDLRRTHLPYRRWVVRDDRLVAENPDEDFPGAEMALWEAKLDITNLHLARQAAPIADNYLLGDEAVAIRELADFKALGGGTVVDVTSIGLKRDPLALERISRATGLRIVMGTGYYQRVYHPDDMDTRTVDQLTATIVRDVTVGIHDGRRQTGLKAGVVGEIGINGGPLTTNERKSMRAAGRASRITGAPIVIHLGGIGAEKHEMLDIVADEGVDLRTVTLGHADDIAASGAFIRELLSRGVFVAFDNLARELEVAEPSLTSQIAGAIPGLITDGFGDRILLSHDICWKTNLKAYGGPGFTFIQEKFLPHLATLGVTDAQIHAIMVANPARALTFAAPRS
jgi:phosphotriesterase-related protein